MICDEKKDSEEVWRKKFENSNSNFQISEVVQYFQKKSPLFTRIEEKRDDTTTFGACVFDEENARAEIIQQIEEFICGENPQLLIDKLRSAESLPTVCGRVFKMGEPTYSCRECSMDATCVLCASCFKKSSHRNHRYKMATSCGGGCCDCGDNEAWKKDAYCEHHALGLDNKVENTLITDSMKQRCNFMFKAILSYCMNSLKIEDDTSMSDTDPDSEDIYCTIMYNDEIHTFEQVIQTLTSVVACTQKMGMEYATNIDTEGRAIIKCGTFSMCMKLKTDIEKKVTRYMTAGKATPLKVTLLHKNAVACQFFALQLLGWFQDFLTLDATIRALFADIINEPTVPYNLKHILLYDHKLWKSARAVWHRLLISGLLMEYENKKALAIGFIKVYTNIMQDFIRDDQYHSYSIVSLSVQIFTVPTIAQHLIAHHDAFFKLIVTFYTECIERHIKNKVLQFSKSTTTMAVFKRGSYILTDLKYLLSFKPTVWTQELRAQFVHGVQILIRLLKCMQGTDQVVRQVGQHQEYEPEWESAFTLNIKLSSLITLVLDWCSSDKVVLMKVYRMVLSALSENKFIISQTKAEVKELADHSATCLIYDVSTKPVSIHLPLSRFLAGLYVNFEKFGLTYDSVSTSADKPTLEQLIEPVLCTRTMISQYQAGMWRRNGFSLVNQIYFYRNVKCRSEMLDRDIIILQIGASLIENNEFLIHVLNKFNLIQWAENQITYSNVDGEEDSTSQVINMVDELLELLIMIVGERFVCGIGEVTEEDRIKKEIIQKLCIKPFSHSELNRALNDDMNSETGMENVIHDVAVFKKSADKKGVYELKPEYYDNYNMYFYHYSREDKSKSEEVQRNRRKNKGELICCPPPKLPKLTETFNMLANLLQCDVMLLVMQTVLKKSLDLKQIVFSESHLQKILHLIGYALQEEESNNYPFLTFVDRSVKWGLLQLMEELVVSARVESQKDLLLWTVKKFKEVLAAKSTDQAVANQASATANESPSISAAEQSEKDERAKLAAKRRAQILMQMQAAQKNFMTSNASLFEEVTEDKSANANMDWQASESAEGVSEDYFLACMGNNRRSMRVEEVQQTCILCSETSVINKSNPCMVYPTFIQKSSVLGRYQQTNQIGELQYLETSIHPSPHTGTCGHVIHETCWKNYFDNEVTKESRRLQRTRTAVSFDIEKSEFLCPLCRLLCNCVLPILPSVGQLSEFAAVSTQQADFEMWLTMMNEYNTSIQIASAHVEQIFDDATAVSNVLKAVLDKQDCLQKLKQHISNGELNDTNGENDDVLSKDFQSNILKFMVSMKKVDPFVDVPKEIENHLITWVSCAYTIESVEMYLRATDKPLKGGLSLRYTACLSGLVRLCSALGVLEFTTVTAPKDFQNRLMFHLRDLCETIFGNKVKSSIFDWDIFGMLISLIFTTRSVLFAGTRYSIANGACLEYAATTAMFLATILKVILNFDSQSMTKAGKSVNMEVDDETASASTSSDNNTLMALYKKFNIYYTGDNTVTTVTTNDLVEEIKDKCGTYLRSCCLLFHFMTDVELPDAMLQTDSCTFEVMCDYLGLSSNIEGYFKCEQYVKFMRFLAEHPEIKSYRENIKTKGADEILPIISTEPPVRQLVSLPDDYSDLINSVSLFKCPNNDKEDSRNPTMCLVCGEILCSQTYCCQKELDKAMVGACTYHMQVSCGAGAGIFLRIRDSEILLLCMNKGCFISAPYLDEYGETDQGLRRGNPLYLCKDSYKKIHLMWLNHGIHEEIARKNESQNNLYPTQWHHF